jgi:Tfp pilus assembly protein PilF
MIRTAFVLAAALAVADVAVAADASTGSDPISAGLAAFKKRRFAQAEEQFAKAVEAEPSSAAAHFYLGYTIYKRVEPKRPFHPDKQRAADEFAKAFELDPSFRPDWGKHRAVEKTEP